MFNNQIKELGQPFLTKVHRLEPTLMKCTIGLNCAKEEKCEYMHFGCLKAYSCDLDS